MRAYADFLRNGRTRRRVALLIYVGLIMTKQVALISGITGQDGSYLAELLIGKGL